MSDFFPRLEAQQRREATEGLMGAAIGVLLSAAFFKYVIQPEQLSDYLPAVFGALPGACVMAAVIEYQEKTN